MLGCIVINIRAVKNVKSVQFFCHSLLTVKASVHSSNKPTPPLTTPMNFFKRKVGRCGPDENLYPIIFQTKTHNLLKTKRSSQLTLEIEPKKSRSKRYWTHDLISGFIFTFLNTLLKIDHRQPKLAVCVVEDFTDSLNIINEQVEMKTQIKKLVNKTLLTFYLLLLDVSWLSWELFTQVLNFAD